MNRHLTTSEIEVELGASIKRLRLMRNMERETLSSMAGVSVSAIKNLENGAGSNTSTLVKVVRALGKEDWLRLLAPAVTIDPIHMVTSKHIRQRASRKKVNDGKPE